MNMSARRLYLPGQCHVCKNPFCTDSLTAFSLICMCLSPFVVIDFDQIMHALLSLYTVVGDLISCCTSENPSTICARCKSALAHSSVAYISASADDLAVTDCHFKTQ